MQHRAYSNGPDAVNGWIAISRQVFDHPVVGVRKGVPFTRTEAWIWLVGNAAFEPKIIQNKRQQIELKRGEMLTSYAQLATAWRWKASAVRWFLAELHRTKSILKHDTNHSSQGLWIIVCNYERFQFARSRELQIAQHQIEHEAHNPSLYKQLTTNKVSDDIRARDGNFWQQALNPQEGDYSLADGVLTVSDDERERMLPGFGGDNVRFDYALTEIAGKLQPNSLHSIARQVEANLAQMARYSREQDARYASAAKRNAYGRAQPAKQVGSIGGTTVRDTSETFADYQARMRAEGKIQP